MRQIFISHSSHDNAHAAALKEFLESRGHDSLFLDFDPAKGIAPGRNWERELYQRVHACRLMIVLCSRASMASRWCFVEITHARALGKPLLALKIDDCELDGVLTDRQAIDGTTNIEQAYERVLDGIRDAGIAPGKLFERDPDRPPYPGLLAFQEKDAAIFFGRDEEIAEGLERLNHLHDLGLPKALLVLGASGTGKSSLARAGLVPRLKRDPHRWMVVGPFRPRMQPLQEVASALAESLGAKATGWVDRLRSDAAVTDPDILADTLLDVQRCFDRGTKILLAIDQFEELFASSDVPVFLEQLRRALDHPDGPAILLGTLRSDFLDRFQSSAPFVGLDYEMLSLGPMSEEDIRSTIEGPAGEEDVEFDPALVAELVREAGTPKSLPLLAFTLKELWEHRTGERVITLAEYRVRLGGIEQVISNAAERVLKSLRMTGGQEQQLRTAFLAMVRIADDGRYVRRSVKWARLPAPIHVLLERFVDVRLLVSDEQGGDRILEAAHERLFDSWARMRTWIAEDVEGLRLSAEIEKDADIWWSAEKPADRLWRGARVARALELAEQGGLLLDDHGRAFIAASHRDQRTRLRVLVSVAGASMLVIVALAIGAAVSAVREKKSAAHATDREFSTDVQRLRALSAQNFAEHQRVVARANAAGLGADEREALEAIAPKYFAQSRRYQADAERRAAEQQQWRRDENFAATGPSDVFTLEALPAGNGAAFFVHYGAPGEVRHLLIDGGQRRTYRDVIKPRLQQLRGGGEQVVLSHVIATQTDIDHIQGLIDLLEDMTTKPTKRPDVAIDALWSNAFVPDALQPDDQLVRSFPKARLVTRARELGIPVNAPFSRMVAAPEAGVARVAIGERSTITILSPRVQWLRQFSEFWIKDWSRRVTKDNESESRTIPALFDSYKIIEDFGDRRIELLPSPIEIADLGSTTASDRSVVNLASNVLMIENQGKRVLLTADARSDVILSALAQAGYTDAQGRMFVDVLVLPHGGSRRNVSIDFFRRITARYYVISSNGDRFGNPKVDTLEMLFEARRNDYRPFTLALTYAPADYAASHPIAELCALFEREQKAGVPFDLLYPRAGTASFGIELGVASSIADTGARATDCGALRTRR